MTTHCLMCNSILDDYENNICNDCIYEWLKNYEGILE
jgi:hypothetical protein